jgi:hypothetical protein
MNSELKPHERINRMKTALSLGIRHLGRISGDRSPRVCGASPVNKKHMNSLFAFAVLCLSAGSVVAEEPHGDVNPALQYYQAILLQPRFEPDDQTYLSGSEWRGRPLDERFDRLISKYDGSFKLLRKAAQAQAPCDWGVDLTEGPVMVMPRLAPAKHLVQIARLRVRSHLQNGRQAEARDDLLAALALGRNLSRDGLGISAAVQFSIEELVVWAVAQNFYAFSPETLQQIANGLQGAPVRGRVAQTIPTAKYLFCDWYLDKIAQFQRENPGNDAKVLELIRDDLFRPTPVSEEEPNRDLPERLIAEGGGTSASVVERIRGMAPLYQELERIMALPYPQYESSFNIFRAEVGRSSNPLAQRLLSYDRARRNEFVTEVQLAMVRAAIAYRLHGEQGLKAVPDPCGNGAFGVQRFKFEGVDRGFRLTSSLKSAYAFGSGNEVLIFVEKDGKPFSVSGPNAGAPVLNQAETMRLRYGLQP